jgi:hypothetical protein
VLSDSGPQCEEQTFVAYNKSSDSRKRIETVAANCVTADHEARPTSLSALDIRPLPPHFLHGAG